MDHLRLSSDKSLQCLPPKKIKSHIRTLSTVSWQSWLLRVLLTYLSAGHDAGAWNQQDSGQFGPSTFQGAGAHVYLHPHEVDRLSRASQPAMSSTAQLQNQGSSNPQTYSHRHGQSQQGQQYQPHMVHQMTHNQGSLLPGLACRVAESMLQPIIRWRTNIQHRARFKDSTHLSLSLSLSRGRSTPNGLHKLPQPQPPPQPLEAPDPLIRLSTMTLPGMRSVPTACGGTPTLRNPSDPMANRFS